MTCQMIVYAQLNGQNRDKMKIYMAEGPKILAQYGGRHVVMGGNPQSLEGAFPWTAVIISEWPSREAALAFWNSPEYTALREYRAGTGEYQIVLVDSKPGA